MARRNVQADVFTYSALVTAGGKALYWNAAIAVMFVMKHRELQPNLATSLQNGAAKCLVKCNRCSSALVGPLSFGRVSFEASGSVEAKFAVDRSDLIYLEVHG